MKKEKKISIIVPVYNAEKYLIKLINSIENQNYNNYEVILVDDGSTDNSYKILQNLSKKNKKIKIYTKKNSGPGGTRKYGFEKSTGELVYFIDADDWLPENSLIRINEIFNDKNPDVLIFDRISYCHGKKLNTSKPIKNISQGYIDLKEIKNDYIIGGLGCKVLKKDILTSDMFLEGYNYEDVATTYLYFDKCNKIYYTEEVLYNINRDDDNISLTKIIDINRITSAIDIILNVYPKIESQYIKESLSLVFFLKYKELIAKHIKNLVRLNFKENKMIIDYLNKIKQMYKKEKIKEYIAQDKLLTKIIIIIYWKCIR